MCTGYMRALDYSEQVVEAGGVPAMLSYLQRAAAGGLAAARRAMVKEALFALSNVAGANCATVRAMLDAGERARGIRRGGARCAVYWRDERLGQRDWGSRAVQRVQLMHSPNSTPMHRLCTPL